MAQDAVTTDVTATTMDKVYANGEITPDDITASPATIGYDSATIEYEIAESTVDDDAAIAATTVTNVELVDKKGDIAAQNSASAAGTFEISGLEAETDYTFYLNVTYNSVDTGLAVISNDITFTTTAAPDYIITKPTVTATTSNLTKNSVDVNYTITETSAASEAEIKGVVQSAQLTGTGITGGSIDLDALSGSKTISGLTPDTKYDD